MSQKPLQKPKTTPNALYFGYERPMPLLVIATGRPWIHRLTQMSAAVVFVFVYRDGQL